MWPALEDFHPRCMHNIAEKTIKMENKNGIIGIAIKEKHCKQSIFKANPYNGFTRKDFMMGQCVGHFKHRVIIIEYKVDIFCLKYFYAIISRCVSFIRV